MDYYNISVFTKESRYQKLVGEVKRVSIEEVPMIWRVPLDGNPEFLDWINQSLSS